MVKINLSNLIAKAVGELGSTKTEKTKENQPDANSKIEKTNENEMVSLDANTAEDTEKSFIGMMIDLVVNFFKKVFGKNEELEPTDETPKINEELAKSVDNKLGDGFTDKLEEVSRNINCDPNDLLTVLFCESSLDPKSTNDSGAVGIMQFMPSTLKELGYTTEDIKNMSASEQLVVVQKYFEKNNYYHKDEKLTAAQLYAMVLAPGKANREVL